MRACACLCVLVRACVYVFKVRVIMSTSAGACRCVNDTRIPTKRTENTSTAVADVDSRILKQCKAANENGTTTNELCSAQHTQTFVAVVVVQRNTIMLHTQAHKHTAVRETVENTNQEVQRLYIRIVHTLTLSMRVFQTRVVSFLAV